MPKSPTVNVHPLGELLSKKLFGIEGLSTAAARIIKRNAIKAAIDWHDNQQIQKGHWTSEPPAEPGYYWYRQESKEDGSIIMEPLEVRPNLFDGETFIIFDQNYIPIANFEGQWWSEPVQPPESDN